MRSELGYFAYGPISGLNDGEATKLDTSIRGKGSGITIKANKRMGEISSENSDNLSQQTAVP